MLHVKLVHLPCARAAIIAIDSRRARRSRASLASSRPRICPQPMPRFGPAFADRPVLAVGETKFFGEPVAAVAAETKDAAEARGRRSSQVTFDELPAVLTVEQRARSRCRRSCRIRRFRHDDRSPQTNVPREWTVRMGRASRGRHRSSSSANTAFRWSRTSRSSRTFSSAAPDENGSRSGARRSIRSCCSASSRRRWGGRCEGADRRARSRRRLRRQRLAEVRAADGVSRAAPRPSRAAGADARGNVSGGPPDSARITRAPASIATAAHRLLRTLRRDFLIGAYADIGVRVVSKASYAACGPYRTPTRAGRCARAAFAHDAEHGVPGFGTPQASWAVESQLDRSRAHARHRSGRDSPPQPTAKGEAFIPNDTPADGDWAAALDRRRTALIAGTRRSHRIAAAGISLGLKSSSTASASLAIVRLHYDGSVTVLSGNIGHGAGRAHRAGADRRQELGVTPDRVAIVMGDTAIVPFDSSTSASRSTVFMGNAVLKACAHIRQSDRHRWRPVPSALTSRASTVTPGSVSLGGTPTGLATSRYCRRISARREAN